MATPQGPNRPPVAPKIQHAPVAPTHDEVEVIYVIVVYMTLIFAFWSLPIVRNVINPFKLFTIGWHELCHALAAMFTGGTITKITIDPILGGCTLVEGGHAPVILAAGYVGSTLLGAAFLLAGWDTLVAKVLSFILAFGLLCPLVLVRDKLTILLTIFYEILLIIFWFVDHAEALRWYCLFIGVMNILYVVWDIADDKFSRKRNESDAAQFALMFPQIPAHMWALFWILFQVAVLVGFILLGISAFKLTSDQMAAQADKFLPT